MENPASRLSRRGFVLGAGVAGVAATGLGLLGGFGCLPLPLQPAPRVPRIGYLSASPLPTGIDALRQGLGQLGYVEGQSIVIEIRSAEAPDELAPSLVAGLVSLPVDVIVASAGPAALAASRATTTIPIVMAGGGDPVRLGLAASLARPGGNVTGLSTLSPALSGKRLELLREATPAISRVGIVSNSTNPSGVDQLRETQEAGRTLGLETIVLDVRGPEGLEGLFETATRERAEALCVLAIGLTATEYEQLAEFATQNRFPSVFALRDGVDRGGLMAYGPSVVALTRRAAYYVDRILKGAKPADLPVEQPMTFDFVVNMKTARELGITFPNEIMLQVTEVLQ
jgi:putative ABC transport system substrate-binding protein